MTRSRLTSAIVVVTFALAMAACGDEGDDTAADAGGGGALTGVFGIEAGKCSGGATSGSFFRMVEPKGKTTTGPFVKNGDSPCTDKTFTPLQPGTEGGLVTGSYQPQPNPPFDAAGNGAAVALSKPQKWFAIAFSLATNPTDPQTKRKAVVPSITNNGGKLSGDLRALAAAWNGQHFNQGAPKPDGSTPGNTSAPTGTYDADTESYELDWASQIVGGPFNNFTGVWHLEGTFEPKG